MLVLYEFEDFKHDILLEAEDEEIYTYGKINIIHQSYWSPKISKQKL